MVTTQLVIKNIIRFVAIILLQILIFNKINIFGYIHPYVYIVFIILLPIKIQGWLLLSIAFLTGFTIDMFEGVMGVHTFATVFAAFIRPFVIKLVGEKSDFDINSIPNVYQTSFSWFVYYAGIVVFFHNLWLNFLDVFSFSNFGLTLWRTILNTLFTLIIIVALQYIFPQQIIKNK